MSKPEDKGSKRSKNKSGPVRPPVSNHDIPKVVSFDRPTDEAVDADAFNFAGVSTPAGKRKAKPPAADADAFNFADVSTPAGKRKAKPPAADADAFNFADVATPAAKREKSPAAADADAFNFADVATPAAKPEKSPAGADAEAFNFADASTAASSSGNRKTDSSQRSATASGSRSGATQGGRGRGKSKKDFELMVAYGTLGAMALVAVIGLAVMLSGGDSASSNKSRNRGRSGAGINDRDPSRSMQSTAEQRRLIEARRNWSRGDVAFPDADPNADEVEPVVIEPATGGDFQLPPPRDSTSPIGAENKHE